MFIFLRYTLALLLTTLPIQGAWPAEKPPLIFSSIDSAGLTLTSLLVLQEAYSAIGERFVVRLYPSSRALMASNNGFNDGAVHRIKGIDKSFPNLLRVPIPINQFSSVAIVKRADIHIQQWQDLSPYHVGSESGVMFFEQRMAGMDVVRLEYLEQLLNMLDRGRLDVVVTNQLSALTALHNPAFKSLRMEEPALESTLLYHYLHKRHRALLPKLNAVLEKMQRNGRIQAIRIDIERRLQSGEALPALPVVIEPKP